MPKPKATTHLSHTPVLIDEVLEVLSPKPGQSYLDLTAGFGGHAALIIKATGTPEQAILVDRDEAAVAALKRRFGQSVRVVHSDFLSTLESLAGESRRFDMILADLGVSSPHLDEPQRGFSFNTTGPLDMRMDQTQSNDAGQLVNGLPEAELADILRRYGEEPKARAIARAIVAARPIDDTATLATTIAKAIGWRGRRGKTNPATRSFQAIRIAVNDELSQISRALPLAAGLLNPGGRLAIISFHSLEDRIVKQFFAEHAGNTYDAELDLLTKKPIRPGSDEIVSNPRARSASLRAGRKK